MTFGLDHLQDVLPVFQVQVHPGRVMAAGMQHDDGACGQRLEVFEHACPIDAVGRSVIVPIGMNREAR